MRIDVITIFPELVDGPLATSIIGRAAESGLVDFGVHDLREHGLGKHRSVDDYPYGGGAGMVMR
ncbi:MAG: tRNA (guanosine(37)-N1)-methyltransferase TrmD, partial [Candidatus Limnocylindria bacterium]